MKYTARRFTKLKPFFISFVFGFSCASMYGMESDSESTSGQGPQVHATGDVHINSNQPIILQTQGGRHNYYGGDDYSGGDSNAGMRAKISNALAKGALEGISSGAAQVIAATIVQTVVLVLKSGLSLFFKEESTDEKDDDDNELQREIAFCKIFSSMVEQECSHPTAQDQERCKQLKNQVLQMLEVSARHINDRYSVG